MWNGQRIPKPPLPTLLAVLRVDSVVTSCGKMTLINAEAILRTPPVIPGDAMPRSLD